MCCWTKFVLFSPVFCIYICSSKKCACNVSFYVVALPSFGMRTIQYWDKQACTTMEWNEQAAHISVHVKSGNIKNRETVGKEEGASVGDCTLNLRWNPWLVSTYGKQKKSTPVRTRLAFWDVWNSSPCAPTFPSLEQSHHSWCTLDRLTPCLEFRLIRSQVSKCSMVLLLCSGEHMEASSLRMSPSVLFPFSWGHRAFPCWKATVFILSRFHVSFHGEKGKKSWERFQSSWHMQRADI